MYKLYDSPEQIYDSISDTRIKWAANYMRDKHFGQTRKYSGAPYWYHPLQVYQLVRDCYEDTNYWDKTDWYMAALLHDVVEDTDRTITDIELEFGRPIANLVDELTNRYTKDFFPELNRQERKESEWERLSKVSEHAKLIKVCDRVCNLIDLYKDAATNQDACDFLPTYVKESKGMINKMFENSLPQTQVYPVLTILEQLVGQG